MSEDRVRIPSTGGELEGRFFLPPRPRGIAVLCHPHPLYGGTMDFPIVEAIARSLAERGLATLRFNFRGVGSSEGSWSGGAGEAEDAVSALGFSIAAAGSSSVALCGYSFGAAIALDVGGREPRVSQIVAVAVPVSMVAVPPLTKPTLVVQGDRDPYGPLPALEAVVSPPGRLVVVRGGDHFLAGFEGDVAARAASFLAPGDGASNPT